MSFFYRMTTFTLVLSAAVLFFRPEAGVRAAEIKPTDQEVLNMARGQRGERWYGIYVLGKKVGWQRDRWHENDQTICNESEFTLKLAFLGKVSTMTSREETCYALSAPYAMVSYRSNRNEDGRRVDIDGSRQDQELVYKIVAGNRDREERVEWQSDLLSHAVGWAALDRMGTGDTISSTHFDELTGKSQWQKYTLSGKEKRTLRGKQQTVYKLRIQDEAGMDLNTLVNEAGIILEGALGPSIRIVLEDKQSAMRKDLDLLDLYSTTFINAQGEIDYARVMGVRKMRVKLSGDSPVELAANGRQAVSQQGTNSVEVTVDACKVPAVAKTPDLERYQKCNADIPCDVDDIKQLARKALDKADKPLDKALALTTWVHRNFQYSLASGGGTGEQILEARKGDCTEYSKALITLLRAADLPARQLSGIVLASDTPPSFGYHAWVEAWIDGTGWVALDPTWGSHPVDATHIVFDVDEGLQMAAHLGGLELKVEEVIYSDQKEIQCD